MSKMTEFQRATDTMELAKYVVDMTHESDKTAQWVNAMWGTLGQLQEMPNEFHTNGNELCSHEDESFDPAAWKDVLDRTDGDDPMDDGVI